MSSENLGRYRIVEELGRGAMGRVFLAHDPQIDRQVAIKTVQIFGALPESDRAEARSRFIREARAAGRLNHPSLVTIYDVDESEGLLYIVMEYVEGRTLDAFTTQGELLPSDLVVDLVAEAAEGFDYLHGGGVVHRDVKPANLIRVGDRRVKIADFGLALPSDAELSQDGALRGTPSYMSPEQIRGETLDGRSDLFSLGCVLFELLGARRPFPGDSVASVIYRIVNEEPVELPGQTETLSAFLARALAKSPSDRFQTGKEFAAALRAAAGDRPESAGQGTPGEPARGENEPVLPPPPRRRPRRSSVAPFVIGMLVIILGGAGAAYLLKDRLGIELPVEPPKTVWWEASVRTEPPGLEVLLDGQPLPKDATQAEGAVRFQSTEPFGLLSATYRCRTAEHRLGPADAGGELVLVTDPVTMSWEIAPDVAGATVALNGKKVGTTPAELELDLCADNQLTIEAAGFRPVTIEIPPGTTPTEARSLLFDLTLAKIPRGKIELPKADIDLVYYVDGSRMKKGVREVELEEGEHVIRVKNEYHWLDRTSTVEVVGDRTVQVDLGPMTLAGLAVQAFPSNCKVYLRRPSGRWKYIDETPARRNLATGKYEVKVELNPTGQTRIRKVNLVAGENPPVRVSFGGSS